MDLYTHNSIKISEITTRNYSTSFSAGVSLLDKRFRRQIYAIYGFVRFADEIVDTFHDQDKRTLLNTFRDETYDAIQAGMSINPILHAFQWVVNSCRMDMELIDAFLHSMEMDLEKKAFSQQEYQTYIYGSAEVVGLMCLQVFYAGQRQEYERLLPAARKLGEAFQKVNFLRDMRSDLHERGRVYFPDVDFDRFSAEDKKQIEQDIARDFAEALPGIISLDKGARLGVYLAYRYYLELLARIKSESPESLKKARFRVSDRRKFMLMIVCLIRHKLNLIR